MSKKENKPKKDINGKLSTYVVVMLLSIIIIIIIAALADDREENIQSQIDSTTQTNLTIQNELVTVKDENSLLSQENDKLTKQVEENSKNDEAYKIISEALNLYNEDKEEEAYAKFSEIDSSNLSETVSPLYEAVKKTIGYEPKNEKQN